MGPDVLCVLYSYFYILLGGYLSVFFSDVYVCYQLQRQHVLWSAEECLGSKQGRECLGEEEVKGGSSGEETLLIVFLNCQAKGPRLLSS
jgi:hypothetical protein